MLSELQVPLRDLDAKDNTFVPRSQNDSSITSDQEIYHSLAQHQTTESWESRDLLTELHRWAEIFVFRFKLQVSYVALTVEYLANRRMGHFRPGHNGFGLKGEIAINRRYLCLEPWETLGTLLHELLHAEQEEHGKPGKHNYHNKAFRNRAAEFGLIVDSRGHTHYVPASLFKTLLAEHGINLPDLPPPVLRVAGASKLKLWMCPCGIRARVAVSDFHARC